MRRHEKSSTETSILDLALDIGRVSGCGIIVSPERDFLADIFKINKDRKIKEKKHFPTIHLFSLLSEKKKYKFSVRWLP